MVGDLGLGKALDVSSRLTMIAGTPSYVAPEQARGESPTPRRPVLPRRAGLPAAQRSHALQPRDASDAARSRPAAAACRRGSARSRARSRRSSRRALARERAALVLGDRLRRRLDRRPRPGPTGREDTAVAPGRPRAHRARTAPLAGPAGYPLAEPACPRDGAAADGSWPASRPWRSALRGAGSWSRGLDDDRRR